MLPATKIPWNLLQGSRSRRSCNFNVFLGSHFWVKFGFCVGSQWPHTVMSDSVLSFSWVISATCHFCFLLASVVWWRGSPRATRSISCELLTGWIMQGMFLIPAGLPNATQHDLSKTLLCYLVSLGSDSQFELVNPVLCVRKRVISGDSGKSLQE